MAQHLCNLSSRLYKKDKDISYNLLLMHTVLGPASFPIM